MRIFKANQTASEEDRAAGLRLENIANRYRAVSEPGEDALPETGEEAPDSKEPPQ